MINILTILCRSMSERKDYHTMKKFLSVLLTLAMMCMMFVTPAFAESAEADTDRKSVV